MPDPSTKPAASKRLLVTLGIFAVGLTAILIVNQSENEFEVSPAVAEDGGPVGRR